MPPLRTWVEIEVDVTLLVDEVRIDEAAVLAAVRAAIDDQLPALERREMAEWSARNAEARADAVDEARQHRAMELCDYGI